MGSKNLVTQGELKNTIEGLGALADNLNEHINQSMSKAHGWSAIQAIYADSGGCYHSGVAGPLSLQQEVRFAIGEDIFFAPAQAAGGIDGEPDVVLPPYTGLISPQNADPALDLTVGSPVDSALVTTFADALNVIAGSAGATLLTHAGSPAETAHGGLSSKTWYQRDNAGHLVGRRAINLRINGVSWMVICDFDSRGPTQIPRFTNTCPQVIDYATRGGSFSNSSGCSWSDYAPSGQDQCSYVIELEAFGTPPMTYKWQYCTDATTPTWVDLAIGGHYTVNANFSFNVLASGAPWIVPDPSGTLYAQPPLGSLLRVAIWDNGSSNNSTNFAYGLRCILDNSSTPDGAIVSSDMFSMAMTDVTSGC